MFFREAVHGKALVNFPKMMNRLATLIAQKKADKDYPQAVIKAAEEVYNKLGQAGYASKRNAHVYQLNTIIEKTIALLDPKHGDRNQYHQDIATYKDLAQTTYGSFSRSKRWLGIAMMALGVAVMAGAMMILGGIPVSALIIGAAISVGGYCLFKSGRQKGLSKSMDDFVIKTNEHEHQIFPK
jgi:hypothetical protein